MKPSQRVRNLMSLYTRRAQDLENQARLDSAIAEQMRLYVSSLEDVAIQLEKEEKDRPERMYMPLEGGKPEIIDG